MAKIDFILDRGFLIAAIRATRKRPHVEQNQLLGQVDKALRHARRGLLIDCARVEHSTAGIRNLLLAIRSRARARSLPVALVNPPEHLLRVIGAADLQMAFPTFRDLEAAMAGLRPETSGPQTTDFGQPTDHGQPVDHGQLVDHGQPVDHGERTDHRWGTDRGRRQRGYLPVLLRKAVTGCYLAIIFGILGLVAYVHSGVWRTELTTESTSYWNRRTTLRGDVLYEDPSGIQPDYGGLVLLWPAGVPAEGKLRSEDIIPRLLPCDEFPRAVEVSRDGRFRLTFEHPAEQRVFYVLIISTYGGRKVPLPEYDCQLLATVLQDYHSLLADRHYAITQINTACSSKLDWRFGTP